MEASTLVGYVAAGVTAAALGVFIFLLFPSRPAASPTDDQMPLVRGTAQGRVSLSESLVAAAPKGYLGWLEKQVVHAGRPSGWTITRILTWKIVLASLAALLGLLFVFNGGPQPFKVVLAIAAVILLF